jgi:transposase
VDRIVGATGLLPALRRKLYHEATDLMQKQVIKSPRWLLLKNPGNLDQNRQEAERLEEALRLNQPHSINLWPWPIT